MTIPILTTPPEKKGGGEKLLEWIPVIGSGIAVKDTIFYFKDGKWKAGSIMTAASIISIAGDALLFVPVVGIGAKAETTVASKGLTLLAKKAAGLTAERVIEVGTIAAEKEVSKVILKAGENANKEMVKRAAETTVEKVAGKAKNAAGGRELLVKEERTKIIDEVINKGNAVVDEINKQKMQFVLKKANSAEKKAIINDIISKTKLPAAPAATETKTGLEIAQDIAMKPVKGFKKAKAKAKEIIQSESWTYKVWDKTRAGLRSESKLEKYLSIPGYGAATIPAAIGDAGKGLLGFAGGLAKKTIGSVGIKPIAATSALTGRKGMGWGAEKVGPTSKAKPAAKEKTQLSDAEYEEKVTNMLQKLNESNPTLAATYNTEINDPKKKLKTYEQAYKYLTKEKGLNE